MAADPPLMRSARTDATATGERTHPPGRGGRRHAVFTALDNWVNLNLVETRTFSTAYS